MLANIGGFLYRRRIVAPWFLTGEQYSTKRRAKSVESSPLLPVNGRKVALQYSDNVISTLRDNDDEMMGPEILLWRYPEKDIVNGSLLVVESNQFCILKLGGTIIDVYETGQHIVQTPDRFLANSAQLTFNSELLLLQHEALYINRATLHIKTSGTAFSREMAEIDYDVDYYIHVATREDATKLIQRMPNRGYALSIGELNDYAWPIIEEAVNQQLQTTPLEQTQGLQIAQNLSQLVHERLQPFLATYGITLDIVRAQGRGPRNKHTRALISLKALGFSDLDAVHHYIDMIKNETNHHPAEYQEELERSLYTILHKTLDRYADEIITLQAELEKTHQSIDAQSTHLQELAHTINSDLQACISVLEASKPSTPVASNTNQIPALPRSWNANSTGKFKVRLAPMDRSIPTTTEPVGAVQYSSNKMTYP